MISGRSARFLSLTTAGLFLAGCSTNSLVGPLPSVEGISGSIYGGQQPVSGATVQLYAVGTTGDGSAATGLLTSAVLTDGNGRFDITNRDTCPSASTLVYLTGTGGSPAPGVANAQIALMVALGPCGSLTPSTFINVNEVTTVAAVYALAPFMTSFSAIGSGTSDAAALASAFAFAGYFANSATGLSPGTNVPANYSVPVAQVYTLADVVGACVNSAGGVSGDGSPCGSLFALTKPTGGTTSTDTVGALLNLANNPTLNTAALYNLIPPTAPFIPTQPFVPPDFSLRLLATSLFTVSPSTVTFSPTPVNFTQPTQTITVTNGTSAGVNIGSASISGVNASDFALVPQPGSDCAITVPANTTCTYQVSFTPSAPGTRAAYFVLNNTSANPSIAVALAGSGAAGSAGPVTLTPSSLAFTLLGVPQALTFTNSGSTPLSINAIQLSSAAYLQTNNCGSSLPTMSSCIINVSVTAYSGSSAATLTVVDDAATGSQIANLTFANLNTAGFPSTVDFGGWAIGTLPSQILIIVGPGVSGSFNFTITGPNAADFSFGGSSSTTCAYNYRFNNRCNLGINYTPSTVGTSTAYVNIAGVGRFTLMGTADPAGVDFGLYQTVNPPTGYSAPITAVNLGSSPFGAPALASFDIQNTGTVSPLSLKAPVISGPNAAEFAATTPSCSSGCVPTITFTPSAAGTRSATLTYTDTANTVTRTLALSGIGTTPIPILSPTGPFYFSNVPVGTVSASQTVTVSAYQNHPVQASLAPINNGGPQPFIFTGPTFCSSTPCTLSVAYAPTSAPADNGANAYVVATDTVV